MRFCLSKKNNSLHVLLSVLLLLLTLVLLSSNKAFAYVDTCSWNIYPQPTVGTNTYKITATYHGSSQINFFFANFHPLSSSVNTTTPPANWYAQTGGGGYATGIASNTEFVDNNESVSWSANITIPSSWGGIDTAAFSSTTALDEEHIKCGGHIDPNEISYENLYLVNLNVPLFKQTAEPWQGLVYDSANLWSPASPTINSWGCALTSAAMVLNYHGLFKLPDSAVITPGTLNAWLKNEKDGYVRNGLVNWLAISRLSKKAKQSGYNENFHHDALEFNRLGSNSQNQLKTDLENGIPGILEEPGHFIVAKGETNSSFLINDPFYDRLTLSDGYQDLYLSLLRFTPSNTDLSYFMFIGDQNLSLKLLDQNNNEIGETFSLLPIQNSLNPDQKSGSVATEFLKKNPESGDYKLTINADTLSLYAVDLYLYDINGDPYLKTITGFINNGKPDTFLFTYDHDNSNNVTYKKVVTYSSFIEDINKAIVLKKINKSLGKNLILQVKLAEKLQPKLKKQSVAILKIIQKIISHSPGTLLKPDASKILLEDVTLLISSI